jgi:DMSO/TMAO reductase YedYZ molybdopterin-dependent catalytic subunit
MKRRIFLRQTGLGLSGLLGLEVVFASSMPKDYIPLMDHRQDPFKNLNKHKQMIVLNDRPLNMEAQAHLLNDEVTPVDKMFVRNNGITPQGIDVKDWRLVIEGESAINARSFTLEE